MKKFRFLVTIAIVIAMVSSFVMADYSVVTEAQNYKITYESGNITITVLSNAAYEVDSPTTRIEFDKDAWTVVSGTVSSEVGTAVINAQTGYPTLTYLDYATLTKETVLLTATFAPVEGKTQVGTKFAVTTNWSETAEYAVEKETIEYTVVAAQAEETTTEVAAANAEYTNVQGGSGDNIFGVWVGTYNVTAGDAAKAIKKVSVAFTGDSHAPFVVDGLNIEGAGTTAFKVAIIGVPETLVNASVATVTIQ